MAVLSAEIMPLEKCALMALLLHMHPVTGQSFPSQATLAKETGCSERQNTTRTQCPTIVYIL
jgi:hypothetical protein